MNDDLFLGKNIGEIKYKRKKFMLNKIIFAILNLLTQSV